MREIEVIEMSDGDGWVVTVDSAAVHLAPTAASRVLGNVGHELVAVLMKLS